MAEVQRFRPYGDTPLKQPVVDSNEQLRKEMNRRITWAKDDRNRHISRMNDCYKYALPWRRHFNANNASDQLDEIFDTTVQTVLQDFAADMLNVFTPRKNDWIELSPVRRLDRAEQRQIADAAKELQNYIFYEMGRSNLYQALQEAYLDLGIGTMCMLIKDIGGDKPLHCEAIPAPEVLITRGPFGYIDGYFRERKICREEIDILWPDHEDLSFLGPETEDNKLNDVDVTDGCWRLWGEKGDETYQYAVQVNSHIVYKYRYSGDGACPFLGARWSRDSTTAWGFGPTYQTITDVKTLNHVRYLDLKNYDKHVDPVTSYEDDGVINIDQGLDPGTWVPRAVGSEPPESLESKARFDVGVFERDELRSSIRRAHYQDRPEQLGKTPPTATQWADERAERARRMGTPATNLVEELQYPIIRRFMYLLAQRGTLPKVLLGGRTIDMQPISSLLRAQEQEEVIRNDRFAELITVRFGPQIGLIVIDIVKFAVKQGKALGIDPDIIRDESKLSAAIEQLMPVLQNFRGAGAAPQIAPPPAGTVGP